jgi:hypothetical protein
VNEASMQTAAQAQPAEGEDEGGRPGRAALRLVPASLAKVESDHGVERQACAFRAGGRSMCTFTPRWRSSQNHHTLIKLPKPLKVKITREG